MLKAAIFDLDGTIADTLDDITESINLMLSELGFKPLSRVETLRNINHGAFELVRRSLPSEYSDDTTYIKKALSIYERYYSNCYNSKTYLYKDINSVIALLKEKRIKLAVLSNKQDIFVKNIIFKLFGENTFDIVLGQGRFPPKPSPESGNFICEQLSLSPNQIAMVGDSHVDMLTAKAVGFVPIGVTWGYRSREVLTENGALYLADKPHELYDIIFSL